MTILWQQLKSHVQIDLYYFKESLNIFSEKFSKSDHCAASYGGVSGEGRKLPYAFAQQ